ncbi:universal stress protein [Lewinella sp. JB7]|uniref:universal stress protein n=1 Tax=Lewinella sp. JB7 TaxID=2962887 RepID=UPI0020C955D5|nr:universal stress protein [Lewinella sp. JB7]MCP9234582.1 universal stress protein [Lewinella sp. JB7]
MNFIRSILVPVDFSPAARNAYVYALRLAEELRAELQLLHVVPPNVDNPGYGTFTGAVSTLMREKARTRMNEFQREGLRRASPELRGIPSVDAFIREGDLNTTVRQHVNREDNHLIVAGTDGSSGWWRDLTGTNASSLIHHAPCPVLVVHRKWAYHPPRALCYATDLQDTGTLWADNLFRVFATFGPVIHFVHVQDKNTPDVGYSFDVLRKLFRGSDLAQRVTFTHLTADDISRSILDFATKRGCDLIVMTRPRKPWLQRTFGGSNTREAVLHSIVPLLILSPQDVTARPIRGASV